MFLQREGGRVVGFLSKERAGREGGKRGFSKEKLEITREGRERMICDFYFEILNDTSK